MKGIAELSKFGEVYIQKSILVRDALKQYRIKSQSKFQLSGFDFQERMMEGDEDVDLYVCEVSMDEIVEDESKVCPKCGRKYPKTENVCLDCLVHLKNISDSVSVSDIQYYPEFELSGSYDFNDFETLLCEENLSRIREFKFSHNDFMDVVHEIKAQAFRNFDGIVKENGIDFDSLEILDKVMLFAKSFVAINYKSFGKELGYFEDDVIYIDDRQVKSLQITTMLHELSHFILHEMLVFAICRILDSGRNSLVSELATFILYYSPFTQLIDEYCAHDVEGRFTVFGFQDYSSFLQIERNLEGEMSEDEIEVTKSIANTFARHIIDILESLIDSDLRQEIKDQFLSDVLDRPDYTSLLIENCQALNEEGLVRALWLILYDGCVAASNNINKLKLQK